jgi:hypothetical protein
MNHKAYSDSQSLKIIAISRLPQTGLSFVFFFFFPIKKDWSGQVTENTVAHIQNYTTEDSVSANMVFDWNKNAFNNYKIQLIHFIVRDKELIETLLITDR